MSFIPILALWLATIVVPPAVMKLWGRQILERKLPKKEKNYQLVKAEVICIVIAFALYFPALIGFGKHLWLFFGVFFFTFSFWLFGIESWVIQRNEFKADEFAAEVSGKDTVIRALRKLADLNLTPDRTGRWFNVLSFHPSIEEWINHLKLEGVGDEVASVC